MPTKKFKYFRDEPFANVKELNDLLDEYSITKPNVHKIKNDIANELIQKLREDTRTPGQKLDFVNAAILHAFFKTHRTMLFNWLNSAIEYVKPMDQQDPQPIKGTTTDCQKVLLSYKEFLGGKMDESFVNAVTPATPKP